MDLDSANTVDDIKIQLLLSQPNDQLYDLSPNSYRLLVENLKED
jgi:hypothetical protein